MDEEEAEAALRRFLACQRAGDFEDFSVAERSAAYTAYYAP
ncbi:hypothetical protein [Streptomyces griseosporeus]